MTESWRPPTRRVGRAMTDIEARFWSKVDMSSGYCWLWTAATTYGYGRFAVMKRQMEAALGAAKGDDRA